MQFWFRLIRAPIRQSVSILKYGQLRIFQANMNYSGYRAAEIRLIFRPAHSHDATTYAFVLWMSPMSRRDPSTGLRKVSKARTTFVQVALFASMK